MDLIIERIKQFFYDNDWHYKYDGRSKRFTFGIDTGEVIGKIDLIIKVCKFDYVVIAIMNPKANNKNINEISKLIHKINYGMKNGNFELDIDDGEIRYKTYVNFSECTISKEVIEDSIFMPIAMICENGKTIIENLMKYQ